MAAARLGSSQRPRWPRLRAVWQCVNDRVRRNNRSFHRCTTGEYLSSPILHRRRVVIHRHLPAFDVADSPHLSIKQSNIGISVEEHNHSTEPELARVDAAYQYLQFPRCGHEKCRADGTESTVTTAPAAGTRADSAERSVAAVAPVAVAVAAPAETECSVRQAR